MLDVHAMIGIPFKYGGRHPEEGLDCYGLVIHFYSTVYGLPVPDVDIYDDSQRHQSAEIHDRLRMQPQWVETKELCDGDVVTFGEGNGSKDAIHCGIYVNGYVLHTTERAGSVLMRFARLLPRVKGAYRLCRA